MLRQERVEDPEEALRLALEGWQAAIWTAIPAILDSFDPEKMTCTASPAIQGIFRLKDGSTKVVSIAQCLYVPVQFARGGGWTHTFPMKKDDEGLLIFSSRCIDAWWQNGGIQPQAEIRFHDLSDGFFIPGVNSVPKVLVDFNTDASEIRNDAGDVKAVFMDEEIDVIVKADTFGKFKDKEIDLKAGASTVTMTDTKIDIVSTNVNITGDLTVTGKLTSTSDTSLGGGSQFLKRADGSNTTKVKGT
jgi:hypothetical protein